MWKGIEAVLTIFLMIGAGIFVSWRKWLPKEAANAIPRLIINLAMPGTIISSLATSFTRQQLMAAWLPLLIVFFTVPVTFFFGKLVASICRIPKTRRGVFTVLFSFSNSVFIGFPVALALFGDAGMPYAVFYYLANTTFFWTLGYYAIRRDADEISCMHSDFCAREVFKKLITAPIITIIIMFVIILLDWTLPDMILTASRYIGNMTTPLSLLFTGSIIYELGLKEMRYEKGIGAVLLGRFILIPAFCFAVCMLVISIVSPGGATGELTLMRNVFTVQIGLPVMMQTAIVAELYGADVEYATKGVVWTTLASLISIPAYMLLFQYI